MDLVEPIDGSDVVEPKSVRADFAAKDAHQSRGGDRGVQLRKRAGAGRCPGQRHPVEIKGPHLDRAVGVNHLQAPERSDSRQSFAPTHLKAQTRQELAIQETSDR